MAESVRSEDIREGDAPAIAAGAAEEARETVAELGATIANARAASLTELAEDFRRLSIEVTAAKRAAAEAGDRARAAEERRSVAEQCLCEVERRAAQAEARVAGADKRVAEAEARARKAEAHAIEADKRVTEAATDAERRIGEARERIRAQAERKLREAADVLKQRAEERARVLAEQQIRGSAAPAGSGPPPQERRAA